MTCTDSINPRDPRRWIGAGAAADRRAPYFGPIWSWMSAPCAGATWVARDEDRYLGPFTRRTAAPVLVVGNYWDPATSYLDGAVRAAKLLPNSRLLSSNSWGHTAYGSSACVAGAVGAYLIRGVLPPLGKVCTGPQPFESAAARSSARTAPSAEPASIPPFLTRPGI